MLTIWDSDRVSSLSDRGKILFWAIVTCPGRLACGVVCKSLFDFAQKLRWEEKSAKTAADELQAKGLAFFGQGCVSLPAASVGMANFCDRAFRGQAIHSVGKIPDPTIRKLVRDAFVKRTEEKEN